jgi:hypothetical protein
MTELRVVEDEPPEPTPASRLIEYGVSWREAKEIAEAYRVRVQRAVLQEIGAGMSAPEAARLTGVSRVTVNTWLRARRGVLPGNRGAASSTATMVRA